MHIALQIVCTCNQAVTRSHTTDSFLVLLTNPGRWFARMHKQVKLIQLCASQVIRLLQKQPSLFGDIKRAQLIAQVLADAGLTTKEIQQLAEAYPQILKHRYAAGHFAGEQACCII